MISVIRAVAGSNSPVSRLLVSPIEPARQLGIAGSRSPAVISHANSNKPHHSTPPLSSLVPDSRYLDPHRVFLISCTVPRPDFESRLLSPLLQLSIFAFCCSFLSSAHGAGSSSVCCSSFCNCVFYIGEFRLPGRRVLSQAARWYRPAQPGSRRSYRPGCIASRTLAPPGAPAWSRSTGLCWPIITR